MPPPLFSPPPGLNASHLALVSHPPGVGIIHHAAVSTDGMEVTEVSGGVDATGKPLSPLPAILLLYAIIFVMVGAQTALFMWKAKHRKSYDQVRGVPGVGWGWGAGGGAREGPVTFEP